MQKCSQSKKVLYVFDRSKPNEFLKKRVQEKDTHIKNDLSKEGYKKNQPVAKKKGKSMNFKIFEITYIGVFYGTLNDTNNSSGGTTM